MPSKNPMVSLSIPPKDLDIISIYQKQSGARNRTQAMLALMRAGLKSINSAEIRDSQELRERIDRLVDGYRMIDDEGRNAIDNLINHELFRINQIAELRKHMEIGEDFVETGCDDSVTIGFIPFRRSTQPASAGTGMYLGPDEFETIYVQENHLTKQASFGIPVTGKSMEPKYHDGDVLLVEKTNDVRIGEVGVFTVKGEGYVKVRGNGELLSLNPDPKYKPVSMDETIVCNGRVIGILDPEWIR